MTDLFLGIDVGTSGIRGVVIDASQTPLYSADCPFDEGGRRDPLHWRCALATVLGALQSQISLRSLAALSVDGTSGTLLAIDGQGAPAAGPYMYNERISDPRLLQLFDEGGGAQSGASALPRAMALQAAAPGARICHQADWISGLFSGRFDVCDENNALKTGYCPQRGAWQAAVGDCGVDHRLLPEVLPAGAVTGRAMSPVARMFGISPDALTIAGTTDGCASFLACAAMAAPESAGSETAGCETAGQGVTVLGSTLTVKLLSAQKIDAPECGVYSHHLLGMWLAGGASNTGGNVLLEHFSLAELARLSRNIDPDIPSTLDYYPLVREGERFPVLDAEKQPLLFPRPASRVHFLQGLLEGIARIEARGYEKLRELGGPSIQSVVTMGGGAQNAVWSAIRERVLCVPVTRAEHADAAFGSARLAMEGWKRHQK